MKTLPLYPNQIVFVAPLGWARIRTVSREEEGQAPLVTGTLYKDNTTHELNPYHCRPATIGVRVFRRTKKTAPPHWQWIGDKLPVWFSSLPIAIGYAKKAAKNRNHYQVKVCAFEPDTQFTLTLKYLKT